MGKNILPIGVYERLSADIIIGRIPPGSSLREEQLAAELGVSRTPVREALRRLAEEGLVEYYPHRGAKLSTPNADRIREVFEIREALEGMAARNAAMRIDALRLSTLRTHFDLLRQQVLSGDYSDMGERIHEEVFASCANERLSKQMASIRNQVMWIQSAGHHVPARMDTVFREHEAILSALEARAPEWAESAMRVHIRNSMQEHLEIAKRIQPVNGTLKRHA